MKELSFLIDFLCVLEYYGVSTTKYNSTVFLQDYRNVVLRSIVAIIVMYEEIVTLYSTTLRPMTMYSCTLKETLHMFRADIQIQTNQRPFDKAVGAQSHNTWNNIVAQKIFRQLRLTLLTLKQTEDILSNENLDIAEQKTIRYKLQPRLRRANESLQDLRKLPISQHPDTVELVQCLTVLILAVDMHINGYLPINQNNESLEMFNRNIDRALLSLNDLRTYWNDLIRG